MIGDLLDGFTLQRLFVPVLRMSFALLLGAVIGIERELHAQAAGLRTHMLISLAAALFALIALELTLNLQVAGAVTAIEPVKLVGAVTAGVGFLAAGAMVTQDGQVRGVTTGASMWFCGAIGLACGTGDVALAALGTVLALLVLEVMQHVKGLSETRRD